MLLESSILNTLWKTANMSGDVLDLMKDVTEVIDLLLDKKTTLDQARDSTAIKSLSSIMDELKEEQMQTKTGSLWLLFCRGSFTSRSFIEADRTGNWDLHKASGLELLPFVSAAGHIQYAKAIRIYLKDCDNICDCLKKAFEKGYFTIRRNPNLPNWCGSFTDVTIEQTLMRSGKTAGGMIGFTNKESAKAKWLLSHHIVSSYTDSLRTLTNVQTGTSSEQHRELNLSRIKKDQEHFEKLSNFFTEYNPFTIEQVDNLVNIFSGVVARKEVNVHNALALGWAIQDKFTNNSVYDMKVSKKDTATTFSVMRKPLKVNGENLYMSSTQVQQRIIAVAHSQGPLEREIFKYELAPVAPSLFNDDGTMRKNTKSDLANYIIESADIVTNNDYDDDFFSAVIICGSQHLNKLSWPKSGTFEDFCAYYKKTILQYRIPNVPFIITVDIIKENMTKGPEQKRRRLLSGCCGPRVIVAYERPIPSDKAIFLSNKENKKDLVKMLVNYLENEPRLKIIPAFEEGDADTLLVSKAIEYARNGPIKLYATDTDVEVMALYHFDQKKHFDIILIMGSKYVSIKQAADAFGHLRKFIPFAHAITGCDTTSAIFGQGKIKAFKVLEQDGSLQESVLKVGSLSTTLDEVANICEKVILKMYGCKSNSIKSLDDLRYQYFTSPKYIQPERKPPTSRAAYFHSARVHHQVCTFRYLKTYLDPELCGFRIDEDGSLVPIITDLPTAPPELTRDIKCGCKSERPCTACTCVKFRMPCNYHCACGGLCSNGSTVNEMDNDDEQDYENEDTFDEDSTEDDLIQNDEHT